jgi:uncharacterized protein
MYNMTKTHVFRLKPGQDLKKEIQSFVDVHHIAAGWIITCVGSLTAYSLRFANLDEGKQATGHFEIVSLAGTLSTNGSHLHMSVSDGTGYTIGGHLQEGNIIYTTAEIIIQQSDEWIFTRENDGTTNWKELNVIKENPIQGV